MTISKADTVITVVTVDESKFEVRWFTNFL